MAVSLFSILFIWMIFKAKKFQKYMTKKENSKQKLWLLEDIIFRNASANAFVFVSCFINVFNSINTFWNYNYSALIAAVLFTFFAIYSYVSLVVLPQNAQKLLKTIYPEYSL
jgi:hypothetical protein